MDDLLLQLVQIDAELRLHVAEAEDQLRALRAQDASVHDEDAHIRAQLDAEELLAQAREQAQARTHARQVRGEAEAWALRELYDEHREAWAKEIYARCVQTEDAV